MAMDPQELALQHGDKAILGIVGLVFLYAGYGVVFGFESQAEAQSHAIAQHVEVIRGNEGSASTKVAQVSQSETTLPWAAQVQATLDPATVRRSPLSSPLPQWLFHDRPNIVTIFPPVAQAVSANHGPPINLRGQATYGKVTISWEYNRPDNRLIDIVRYEVFRREGAEGQWTGPIATIEVERGNNARQTAPQTHEDRDVRAQGVYFYRVRSVAALSAYGNEQHATLADSETEKESTEAGPFEVPIDLAVVPSQVILQQDRIETAEVESNRAMIKVYRWDADRGAWLSSSPTAVSAGDQILPPSSPSQQCLFPERHRPQGGPAQPCADRSVRLSGGERVSVDFLTPYYLVEAGIGPTGSDAEWFATPEGQEPRVGPRTAWIVIRAGEDENLPVQLVTQNDIPEGAR